MTRFLAFIVLVALLAHGYLFIRYESAFPCRAAIARALEEKVPMVTSAAKKALGNQNTEAAIKVAGKALAVQKGYEYCYRYVFLGEKDDK